VGNNAIDKRGNRAVSNSSLRQVGNAVDARMPQQSLYSFASLEDAFPKANPGLRPFGSNILVQLRTPPRMSKGGIALPEESRETDHWNTQVAKLVAVGPVAFRNRDTMELWPEGAWAEPGAYIRVPKYGGDRWWVDAEGHDGKSLFVIFNDMDMIGEVPEDKVLGMVAYIL
jgi:co-chaperonin GroES (HSP10)